MLLDQLRYDLRYALRQIAHAPAFTLTVTLTLALGIGATTAIFTLIHAVMLKALPVPRPEQLYGVGDSKHTGIWSGMQLDWGVFSREMYEQFRDHTEGFESLTAFQADPRLLGVRRAGSSDSAESYYGQYVAGNYFPVFGVDPSAGRLLAPDDDRPGAAPVAVMSYRVWQQKYALDPAVIGSTFNLNSTPVTIVGVTNPGFFGETLRNNLPDFWIPVSAEPAVNHLGWANNPDLYWLSLMGRVKPGADVRRIEAQMRVELRQYLTARASFLTAQSAAQIPRQSLHVSPGASGIAALRDTYASGLRLLMTVSGFVLLIVCANIANLMLVKGLARRQQTSINLALGAARWRLMRQALTESLVLALIGGTAGLALAYAGTRALLGAVFVNSPQVPVSASPDLTVLLFALAVSVLTGIVFGVAPAWAAHRSDPIDALRGSGRSTAHTGSLGQRTLVVLQAAVSLVLLVAAGLLTRSLSNLANQQFGFAAEGRMEVRIDPNLAGYKIGQLEPLYSKIQERLCRVPGVLNASYALYSPMSGSNWTSQAFIAGQPPPATDGVNIAAWNRVGPGYFETVGTRILRGRTIIDADTAATRHVAVVNEEFVRQFFAGEDPIGKHFGTGSAKYSGNYEIVGVAENAKYREPEKPAPPMYFLPRSQSTQYDDSGIQAFENRSMYANDIVLRVSSRDQSIATGIRRAFAEIDPNLTIARIRTFDTLVSASVVQYSLIARLTSLFGLTALLLASIGLYGVTSYSVERRSKEIGIRVALGARPAEVVALVLANAGLPIAIGLALGVPFTFAMRGILASKLYGIAGSSPTILAGAVGMLALCALIAAIAPARRAASIDPILTLRAD